MKLILNLILFIFALRMFGDKAFSLTDYKIKIICKKQKKETICIKNLLEKRSYLQKGNKIEIPVIPYKGNQNLNFKF